MSSKITERIGRVAAKIDWHYNLGQFQGQYSSNGGVGKSIGNTYMFIQVPSPKLLNVNDGKWALEGGEADETRFIKIQIAAVCLEEKSKTILFCDVQICEFEDVVSLVSKLMVLKILLEEWSLLEDVFENFMQWESNAYTALDDA
uniref:ARID DNA-binding domain-containing protein n=1 Tax=Tanacetum cinerariifolium TaxID=118510 RepID=A0A699HYJ3_TANCI|nr:ARID DNA-binding domain-containing protein [Tanacetum cinerariifolium]